MSLVYLVVFVFFFAAVGGAGAAAPVAAAAGVAPGELIVILEARATHNTI
jgi:hypothetical protein